MYILERGCSARTMILLSTRQETSLMMFMYRVLSSLMFSTGHESWRFVPCKALYSDKKFSFANIRVSAASHGKKVSSTYTRYACGTFLPNSLHLLRLFAKVLILYNRHGWRWFHANAMFWALLKTRSQRLYTDVQSLTVDKYRVLIFSICRSHSFSPLRTG